MLKELQIRNFAIIDDITVQFGRGLNILSGETGAGKTLIIEAINMLLGERADSDLIRDREEKLVVQGYFDLSGSIKSIIFLKEENLADEEDDFSDIVITREVNRQGKNRAFINGIFTQVSVLKNLGKCFLDLHGQHDHQYLLDPDTHINIIDSFGRSAISPLKQDYESFYRDFIETGKELIKLLKLQSEKELRLEELKFRLNEITKLQLKPDEESELESEKNILKNYEKIFKTCSSTINILNSGEEKATSFLDDFVQVQKNILELSTIDKKFEKFSSALSDINPVLQELNNFIKNYSDHLEFSTERLDYIQERLFKISEIKRKYSMTIPQINDYAEKINNEIVGFDSLDFDIDKKQQDYKSYKIRLAESAVKLSDARCSVAEVLREEVKKELADLNLKSSVFEIKNEYITGEGSGLNIDIDGKKIKPLPDGIDSIEFFISLNPGESARPLRKVASGGEISRIMLGLKSIISGIDNIIAMIFDEIDTGIGGSTAVIVGKKLFNISRKCQVICITHLPQIAAFADCHYFIDKILKEERTKIKIKLIDSDAKIREIARMLGGRADSGISFQHAVELLNETAIMKSSKMEEEIKIGN